jgi:hypothetical protein
MRSAIVVVGDAEGIRATVQRLLPLTAGGHQPQVVGMLIAPPSPDWQGSLLNPEDARSLADAVSKSAGSFAVPVGIDFKGAASWPLTSTAGVEPGHRDRPSSASSAQTAPWRMPPPPRPQTQTCVYRSMLSVDSLDAHVVQDDIVDRR